MLIRTRSPYNRLFHDLFGDARPLNEFANGGFSLALDVEETAEGYNVRADLPGISLDDISVNIHDDVLSISAETASESSGDGSRVLIRERRFGKFSRSLRFPVALDGDAVAARYDNGVLSIALPKAEHLKPRQIPVSVSAADN